MKKAAVAFAVLAAVALVAVLIVDAAYNKTSEIDFFAMNTYISAKISGKTAEEDCEEIEKIVSKLDTEVLSRTAENSVVSQINKNGSGEVGSDIFEYFSLLFEICEKSSGAFDFTLGAISDLWDFGGKPSVPNAESLSKALSHSGYEKVSLSGDKITLGDANAVIDFGAAGKGIALDCVKDYLKTKEVKKAVVSVGGSVLLYGEGDFTVGVRNPYGNSVDSIANLHISAGCVSTSGIYEQNFEQNGKIYHHIFNPETGYPVDNGLISVVIISESGILSDALSTACFVSGMEKGFELAREFGAKAVFITDENKIYAEKDAADYFELISDEYELILTQ